MFTVIRFIKNNKAENLSISIKRYLSPIYFMKMNQFTILFLFLLLNLATTKIILSNDHSSKEVTEDTILQSPYVLVSSLHQKITSEDVRTLYCRLKVSDKNKRYGYSKFMKDYDGIVGQLVSMGVVPNLQMMVHSTIRIKFNAHKRKWEFVRYFVLIINKNETPSVLRILKNHNAFQLKQAPTIRYLNEKYQALEAFHLAKLQLQNYLNSLEVTKKLTIILVEDIQIEGIQFKNREAIQSELEYQANNSEPQVIFGDLKGIWKSFSGNTKEKGEEGVPGRIHVQVLFRVGEEAEKEVEIVEEEDDVSISEFQGEQIEENTNEEQAGQNISLFEQNQQF